MPIGFDDHDRVVIAIPGDASSRGTQRFVRYDTLGVPVDTLTAVLPPDRESWVVSSREGSMSRNVPFAPRLVRTFDPGGGLLAGWSGDYRIVKSATGRDTVRAFGRAWTPLPIPEAMRRAAVEEAVKAAEGWDEVQVRNAFKLSDVPSTYAAFERIEVDAAGNIWVASEADSLRTVFDVFDPQGVFLGPVLLRGKVSSWAPLAWGPNLMYVAMEDDGGTPEIRRYRIDR
jgi:hypothetical protein